MKVSQIHGVEGEGVKLISDEGTSLQPGCQSVTTTRISFFSREFSIKP